MLNSAKGSGGYAIITTKCKYYILNKSKYWSALYYMIFSEAK